MRGTKLVRRVACTSIFGVGVALLLAMTETPSEAAEGGGFSAVEQKTATCGAQVCALYKMEAEIKAKGQCHVKTMCGCTETAQVCDKNWRGKHKMTWACVCNKD